MITEMMIEAGARGLCRLRIEHNTRFEKTPRDETFKQRCEDASWKDFVVEATAALEAAERAAVSEEPAFEKGAEAGISASIAFIEGLRPKNARSDWTQYARNRNEAFVQAIEGLLVMPLPSPPEAPKGEG